MKKFIKENWIAMIPYVMFVIMIIVMGALNSNTLSIRYIANKSDAALSLILVAAGQTLVLLTGGFDLSVGGVQDAEQRGQHADLGGDLSGGWRRNRRAEWICD